MYATQVTPRVPQSMMAKSSQCLRLVATRHIIIVIMTQVSSFLSILPGSWCENVAGGIQNQFFSDSEAR